MKPLADHLPEVAGKRVLVRCNFDVPIEDSQVQDTTRIENAVPTLKALIENHCKVIMLSHYDRPEGQSDPSKSLRPIIPVLEPLINQKIEFIEYDQNIKQLSVPVNYELSLVENLRFWPGEEKGDQEFALTLASWGEVYVNEAFANCHRKHASIVGLPKHLPSYAGYGLAKEIEVLSKVRTNPDKPLVVIIGGAKIETKEPLIAVFTDKADHILVGGKSAVDLHGRQDLPSNVHLAQLKDDQRDVTADSARQFADIVMQAKTVVWNGTMGVYEEEEHMEGTRILAQAVNTTPGFTIIGGGDTETALTMLNLESGIDFISTGGGAMLTFLSEGKLVGVEALNHEQPGSHTSKDN